MITVDIGVRLVNVLAEHYGIFPINKEKFVKLLVLAKLQPTSKFHIELPNNESSIETLQETTDRYHCLSIRRVLINKNINKISFFKKILNVFNIGWSSSVFSRRLRLDKQVSSLILESDCPFSLLAKLETYDFCEGKGSGKFFRISRPILIIANIDKEKNYLISRWEKENSVYEQEVGILFKYFKKISYKKYIAYS